MGNCLVTTLKGSVDNPSLPQVGEIHIHLNNSVNEIFRLFYRTNYALLGDIKARIEGNAHFTNADGTQDLGKTFTGTAGSTADMRVSTGECDLFVNHKYECMGLWVQGAHLRCEMDVADLMYSQNSIFIGLSNTNVFGDLSGYTANLETLFARNIPNLRGNIDALIKASSFAGGAFGQQTGYVETIGSSVDFDLSSIAGKSAITSLSPGTTCHGDIKYHADINDTNIRDIGHAGITGSIESLVARAQAAPNNKTTGSLTFSNNPKAFVNVTFEGVSLASNANVPDKTGAIMAWDAQGNVTWS